MPTSCAMLGEAERLGVVRVHQLLRPADASGVPRQLARPERAARGHPGGQGPIERTGDRLGARGIAPCARKLMPQVGAAVGHAQDGRRGGHSARGSQALDRRLRIPHRQASVLRVLVVVPAGELEAGRGHEDALGRDVAPDAGHPEAVRPGLDEADRMAGGPLLLGVAMGDGPLVFETLHGDRRRSHEGSHPVHPPILSEGHPRAQNTRRNRRDSQETASARGPHRPTFDGSEEAS